MGGKGAMYCMTSGALRDVRKKPNEGLTSTAVRTQNRIRSPRLAASGLWSKVGKGSRQLRSVTSGEGLALGAGWRDPHLKSPNRMSLPRASGCTVNSSILCSKGGNGTCARPLHGAVESELEWRCGIRLFN